MVRLVRPCTASRTILSQTFLSTSSPLHFNSLSLHIHILSSSQHEGSSGAGPSNRGTEVENREGDGKALVTYTGAINPRGNDQDFIRRSEMDALIKRLKDNGNIHGYSFGASMIARTIEMTPNVAEIARIDSKTGIEQCIDRNARMNAYRC
ncbi:hypothetical protein YC2023_051027 [Brassica napus]